MFNLHTEPAKWHELNKRKWELKHDGVVLATISYRPKVSYGKLQAEARFSAYFSVPKIFEDSTCDHYQTYKFETFEEAQAAIDDHYKNDFLPWLEKFLDHYGLMIKEKV